MKRHPARRSEAGAVASEAADSPAGGAEGTMESIAAEALALADRARSAGFPAVSHMLEIAALEAAAAATTSRWPNEK